MSKKIIRRQFNTRIRKDYLDEIDLYSFKYKKDKYKIIEDALVVWFKSKGIAINDIGKKSKEKIKEQIDEQQVLADEFLRTLLQEADLLFKKDEEATKCLKLKRKLINHLQKNPTLDFDLRQKAETLIEQLNEVIVEDRPEIKIINITKKEDKKDPLSLLSKKIKGDEKNE